jgi:hypothetical protein
LTRLRSFHLRASTFARRATADKSRCGGEVAATARQRRVRQLLATAAIAIIGGGSSVFACPLCFGAEETSLIDGTRLGVLVLLAITLVVQGGFLAFFLYLRKRAKHAADIELDTEWSELQGAPRTS